MELRHIEKWRPTSPIALYEPSLERRLQPVPDEPGKPTDESSRRAVDWSRAYQQRLFSLNFISTTY